MRKLYHQAFALPLERGVRLSTELLVYTRQRCMCPSGKHIDEDKIIIMISHHWPGSELNPHEKLFIGYIAAVLLHEPQYITISFEKAGLDIGMGADHCIQKLYKLELLAINIQLSQKSPGLN